MNEGPWGRDTAGGFKSAPQRQVYGPLRDELQHRGNTLPRFFDTPAQSRYDVAGRRHTFAVTAQRAREIRVIAADVGRSEAFGCGGHEIQVARHAEVVEHDRQYRQPFTDGGLEVHAGEADGGIAAHVDAELVRSDQLRTERQTQSIAQLCGVAPPQVTQGSGAGPKRRHLVAWAPCIVRDDGV